MTRLLREHPEIGVELDGDGRLVAIAWNGQREPVEVCNTLAGRGVVVARADRARLLQGRRAPLAGARLPRPGRRHVASGAALRLRTRCAGRRRGGRGPDQAMGAPTISVTTRRSAKRATTKTAVSRSFERVVRCCTPSPQIGPVPSRSTDHRRRPFTDRYGKDHDS